MIAYVASSVLTIIISMVVKTHAWTIAEKFVMVWVWLYSVFAPEDEREGRREEVASFIHEQKLAYQQAGHSLCEAAVLLIERWAKGMMDDIVWGAPFIPGVLADRVKGWGDTLRHYRVPNAMIAGVAVLGLMDYSFFSSPNGQSIGTWLFTNTIGVALTVLLWKHNHPLARRIFHAWMGLCIAAGLIGMVWMTIHYRLYDITTIKILALAMVTVAPAIIIVDKSWRNRLFGGRWWLIAICWAPIIAGSFAGSLLIAQSVKPLLEMWAVIALLVVSMVIVYGAIGLAAWILCLLGIRGGAEGLRLVASGIRRLN